MENYALLQQKRPRRFPDIWKERLLRLNPLQQGAEAGNAVRCNC
jgi:hypothetical protein